MNAETLVRPIFGEITLADMQGNEMLTRTVMPLIKEVCAHSKGLYTVESIADGLVSKQYALWGVMRPPAKLESVAVTRVIGPVFEIVLIGPDVDDMFSCLPILERAAKAAKCTSTRLTGPAFWKKDLPEGWRQSAVVFEHRFADPS